MTPAIGKRAYRQGLVGKTRVNMHLNNDIIAAFEEEAGGRGYQTLINAALREHLSGRNIKAIVEQEVREAIAREFNAHPPLTAETAGGIAGTDIAESRWRN